MTEAELPFLRAVLAAAPDSDVERLIYADWLDERGDPRGEFVRVQCELAECVCGGTGYVSYDEPVYGGRTTTDCQRCVALRRRERELLEVVGGSPWPGIGSVMLTWRRGFVEEIECTREAFARNADAIRAATPLKRVRLTTRPTDALCEPIWNQWIGVEFELPPTSRATPAAP